jgi:serine/threonine-protein kinase
MEADALKKINKYDVVDVIGRGGMGVVYKAIDRTLDRMVAIKMVTTATDDPASLLKRFYREAQFTGNLRHPNIVTVYDLGDLDGRPYLVMEYLEGHSLEWMLAMQPMTMLEKIGYVRQVCNGLEYAHTRQPSIVHRDIKPANIVVLKDGTVKIIDFGIARLGHSRNTRSGQLLGSYHYMSPEQINDAELDERTDIFSTGVVLYQLLTLKLPFEGSGIAQTLNKIATSPAPPLREFIKDYPPALDEIMAQALAKNRDQRYRSARDFAFELIEVEQQLKRELFGTYIRQAEGLLHDGEFDRARQELQQVLKVDHQNSQANELMRQVQQAIARQQRKRRARDLRAHAEQALKKNDVAEALASVEQAVRLDNTATELQAFRERVLGIHARAEKLNEVMARAERAYTAQDLDGARLALDEALQLDPNAPRAKAFKAIIDAKLAEREKERQVEDLLSQARRQISLRRFTGALELLRSAESLKPDTPGVRDLIALAEPAHEQEQRRRAIEEASAEINEALDHPDPSRARELAESALSRFPGERSLVKLKSLAEQQIEAQRRHSWAVEQMNSARNLLESGKSAEALAVLEAASQKYPGEGDLESLASIVRAAIQREQAERRRAEYVSKAKNALRRKDYSEAIKTLEAAQAETKSHDFDELLQFAKDEAAHFEFQQRVDAAATRAQELMDSGDYEQAVHFIESALRDLPDGDLRILLASAQRQLTDFQKGLDQLLAIANQRAAEGRWADALACLEAHRATYDLAPRFHAFLQQAREQCEKRAAIEGAVAAVRSRMERGDPDAAERQLSTARRDLGEVAEWDQLELDIQAQRAKILQAQVETALGGAERLLRFGADSQALASLEATSDLLDKVPPILQSRYNTLKTAITRRLAEAKQQPRLEPRETRKPAQESTIPTTPNQPGSSVRGSEPRVWPAALRKPEVRDQSVMELTPPDGFVMPKVAPREPAVNTPASSQGVNTAQGMTLQGRAPVAPQSPTLINATMSRELPGWREEVLREVARQLAVYIGPLARVIVKRAASRTTDLEQLYEAVATSLEREDDREVFLAHRVKQHQRWAEAPSVPESAQPGNTLSLTSATQRLALAPEAADRIARTLARYVGPISGVLVKKAAQRADSLRALHLLLAEHVKPETERARFLSESGFPDS